MNNLAIMLEEIANSCYAKGTIVELIAKRKLLKRKKIITIGCSNFTKDLLLCQRNNNKSLLKTLGHIPISYYN